MFYLLLRLQKSCIYKYYIAYSLLEDQRAQKEKVRSELLQQTPKPQ